MAKITYLELPVADTGRAKVFYAGAFGLDFTDFGPTYASTLSGAGDIGLQADPAEKTAAALPVMQAATYAIGVAGLVVVLSGRYGDAADLRVPGWSPLPVPRS